MTFKNDKDEPVTAYRAYRIGAHGHIDTFVVVEAQSDEDAINQARTLADGHVVELWDRARLVARFDPTK